ncbi:MAG: hypothetical protein IT446_06605 [Phycisphaerales bacterium]|nr:hypothetical protein [Phycisphaerales bacterium]
MATPAWNDTFGEGLVWQDNAFLAMFEQAVWERQQANAQPAVSTPPPAVPVFSQTDTLPGHVVQGIVRRWQATVAQVPSIMYPITSGVCIRYILPDLDVASVAPGDWPTAYANDQITWQPATLLTAVNGHEGWTRKYEQRFATMVHTTYTDGRAATDGDLARCLADWKVYLRSGGAWVADASTSGDTVTAYGNAQAGDYIGHWCFTELRDALNLLVRSYTPTSLWNDSADGNSAGSGTPKSSASAARSAADGAWPEAAEWLNRIYAAKRTSWSRSGPDVVWVASTGRVSYKTMLLINPIVPVSCDHWLYFQRYPNNDPSRETYDNQNDHAAAENTYWKWLTRTPTSTNDLTDHFSDASTNPPHWGTAPTVDGSSGKDMTYGYMAHSPIAIANWQFTQGPA